MATLECVQRLLPLMPESELRGVGRRCSRHPCSCWCPSDKRQCFRMSRCAPFGRSQVRYPAHGLQFHNGRFSDLSAFDFIKMIATTVQLPKANRLSEEQREQIWPKGYGSEARPLLFALFTWHNFHGREWEVRQLFMGELICIYIYIICN